MDVLKHLSDAFTNSFVPITFLLQSNSITVRSPPPKPSKTEDDENTLEIVTPLASGAVQSSMKKSKASVNPVVPPFKPIPPADERPAVQLSKSTSISQPTLMGIVVPAFHSMPSSITRFSVDNPPSNSPPAKVMAVVAVPKKQVQAQDRITSTNFAVRTLPSQSSDFPDPVPQHSNSIKDLLEANNITEEALEMAYLQRQQILSKRTTTTTSTTTYRPTLKYANSVGKVMNAPKEYYPVGYDKNFDDNFAARVDLPETTFYCGDQKHFPGLYADEDLGCMVSSNIYLLVSLC